MIIKSAEFVTSAVKPSQYPLPELPEIAFVGRSNVGKSSLINTLVNRKRLVKTSSTPGRTQLINFFNINGSFSFVDLPGYGYAKVPDRVKKDWALMIETYLSKRETLKGVVLIMDIRRISDHKDKDLIDWLIHFNIPKILVLTKTDKLSKTKGKNQHNLIAETLLVNRDDILLFSAKTRMGKNQVWEGVERLMRGDGL
ncbi:MAG: YihA family ribosome biogenesis GTP-binding protein [Deltaproteobacteria bacterium]|nr:YihA family ribosome biogenesis GTP-binding protein [Deltaproteobacteria bacterium]